MLYKKYHRNFVKLFKIGAWIKFIYSNAQNYFVISGVEKEPFIQHGWINTAVGWQGEKYWVVVFPDGKINKDLHVI